MGLDDCKHFSSKDTASDEAWSSAAATERHQNYRDVRGGDAGNRLSDDHLSEDEPEDLSLSAAERNSRTRFWNFVERKKKSGEIVLACSACLLVFADPLLYRMHVGTHAIGRSFQCVACGTVCSDRVAFQKHLITARHG